MLATIRDDTRNMLNILHITPNSKRWDYSDTLGGGHKFSCWRRNIAAQVNIMPADALAPSICHQSISRHGIGCVGETACIVVPELISSTLIKPNPRYDSKCEYSWVQSGGPVTTESIVRFDSWFELFEVFRKKWAPMTLAKMAAEFVRSQNPKWPPAAILKK